MRRLAIVQAIHLSSRRVPRKLLERIGDRTLVEWGLQRLTQVQLLRNVSALIAVSYEDRPLRELVDAHGIERIEIGAVTAAADGYANVFSDWTRGLSARFDWVIDANIVCRPFLRLETVVDLVDRALLAEQPFVATVAERGLIWNEDRQMLIGIGQVADSKNNPRYFRLAHLGYAHPADLWEEGLLSRVSRPEAFSLQPVEHIDIDTPEDLAFARIVHEGMKASTTVTAQGLCDAPVR